MICVRQMSLTRNCDHYAKEYEEASEKVNAANRSLTEEERRLAVKAVERARQKRADMLTQLNRHKQEHGC